MSPPSTAFWIAIGKGLVDFFGGKLDYNDCDEKDVDYRKPARKDIHAEDGDEWAVGTVGMDQYGHRYVIQMVTGNGFEDMLDAILISGNETTVANRVRELAAAGVDEILCSVVMAGDNARASEERTLRTLGALSQGEATMYSSAASQTGASRWGRSRCSTSARRSTRSRRCWCRTTGR